MTDMIYVCDVGLCFRKMRKMAKTEKQIVSEHEELLYPVVRIRVFDVGGSGLIVYSKPLPDSATKYETYVMTCFHVVEKAVKFIEKWSDLAQRMVKREDRALVQVEVFEYEELSKVVGGTTYNAEIVAWDKQLDLALLKLKTTRKFYYVAKLFPKGKEDKIKLGMPAVSVGCSLGHEPLMNFGNIVSKGDMIENKEYWMSTANTIFGNSGGAEFLADNHEFIGITAQITGIQLGFSVDIITWMGFFVPITSIYKFWDDRYFMFLYDKDFNSRECAEMREKKRKEEERKLYLPPELLGPTRGKKKIKLSQISEGDYLPEGDLEFEIE